MNGETWSTWSKYVLQELQRLNEEIKEANKKSESNASIMRIELESIRLTFMEFKTATITEARVKNGFWGAVSGAAMAVVIYLAQHTLIR